MAKRPKHEAAVTTMDKENSEVDHLEVTDCKSYKPVTTPTHHKTFAQLRLEGFDRAVVSITTNATVEATFWGIRYNRNKTPQEIVEDLMIIRAELAKSDKD